MVYRDKPTITLTTWTVLVLSPNRTLTLIQASSSWSNNWKKAAGLFASSVEMEEQIVKFPGKVELWLCPSSPTRIAKSSIKLWSCTVGFLPRPVSIALKALLPEERRARRKNLRALTLSIALMQIRARRECTILTYLHSFSYSFFQLFETAFLKRS